MVLDQGLGLSGEAFFGLGVSQVESKVEADLRSTVRCVSSGVGSGASNISFTWPYRAPDREDWGILGLLNLLSRTLKVYHGVSENQITYATMLTPTCSTRVYKNHRDAAGAA